MRTLTSKILSCQAASNRKPTGDVIIRDVMLRFTNFTGSAWTNRYPDATAGDNDIPQCPIDVLGYGAHIQRAWMDDSDILTFCVCADPADAAEWITPTYLTSISNVGAQHRISMAGNRLFYAYNNNIYYCTISIAPPLTQLEVPAVFRPSAYSGLASTVALAATGNTTCYMAQLHTDGDFKYVSLNKLTATTNLACPHTIVVDADYDQYSLTWFDAVALGSKSVIVLNERAHGHPVVILYDHGVWSQPRPIMPMDLVDQYSYLRISGMSVIADSAAEDVIWATGRMGFKGSTGSHPQEFDVVLRSKDGEHWSLDRYCYVCRNSMRSRFLVHDGYVYYGSGATIERARQTWLMGADPAALKHTLGSDVLSWGFSQPAPGSPAQGTTHIAAHADQYGVDDFDDIDMRWETGQGDLAIHPGAWLWRYAGYSDENALLSTEIIDRVTSGYQAGDRQLSTGSRDMAMRLMDDWGSSQDWQWLSQQKHHDGCDLVDYLYSVTAAQIRVPDQDDDETASGVDEEDIATTDNNAGLEFKSFNRPGIFFCTKPFDARNFRVSGRFQFHHEGDNTDASGLGHNLWLKGLMASFAGLSYDDDGDPYFTDTNITADDPYPHLRPQPVGFFQYAPAEGQAEAGYIIVVTNTDGSYTWAYLGFVKEHSVYQSCYAWQTKTGTAGWNGAGTDGKTPSSYIISRCDDRARIGEGFGVVGCAIDKYNLVAAFMGIAEEHLYLLMREGNKDDGAPWFILGNVALSEAPYKNRLYEVELVRNGHNLTARAVQFSSSGTRTEIASIDYNWDRQNTMIRLGDDEEWDDRGKVGIICNINVPETQIYSASKEQNFVIRNPAIFTRNWIVYTGDPGAATENDSAMHSWDDDYKDFTDGVSAPPLWFGGEKYLLSEKEVDERALFTSLKKTGSNRATKDCLIYFRDYDPLQMCGYQVGPQNMARPTAGWSTASPFFWLGINENGIGIQATGQACARAGGGGTCAAGMTDFDNHRTQSYARAVNWTKVEVGDLFRLIPGFYLPGRGNSDEATSHGAGTVMRQHYEPYIRVREVQAYDGDSDKTLEWVLKDMASKAGVLDFDMSYFTDTSETPSQWDESIRWMSLNEQHGFDITIDLGTEPGTNQTINLIARAPSRTVIAPNATNLTSLTCVMISYGIEYTGKTVVQLAQTNSSTGWKTVDRATFGTEGVGTKVRFIGKDNFFTVEVDGRHLRTMHAGPINGQDSDGWSTDLEAAGEFGLVQYNGSWGALSIIQPELWPWTDGIILSQRMSATAGFGRAIRDRHVKWFGKADGSLRISTFAARDEPLSVDSHQGALSILYTPHRLRDLGQDFTDWEARQGVAQFEVSVLTSTGVTFTGYLGLAESATVIAVYKEASLTTAGWNSVNPDPDELPLSYTIDQVSIGDLTFQDSTGPTDRIPTHIRVSGEEESEYIAHTAAALYGMVYSLAQCPSLDEEEAYLEAQRIIREALSYSDARQPSAAAEINWETEDLVAFGYVPRDGGATIESVYIVDSISFGYQPGQLDMRATLRDHSKALHRMI